MHMHRIMLIFTLALISIIATASPLSENQIKDRIINKSISSYLSSVGVCPCPYSKDRIGRLCEKRSAWSRPGGNTPICYISDVTKDMVQSYREKLIKKKEVDQSQGGTKVEPLNNRGNITTDKATHIPPDEGPLRPHE